MMQHVHAGADRLCRERYGAAFERVGCTPMWVLLSSQDACTLLQFSSLWRYLGASLLQNAFKAVYEVEAF